MKRKWVLLSLTIILFLFMFYIAFKILYLEAYIPASEITHLSWLTELLRDVKLISADAAFVANPAFVNYMLILLATVFLAYTLFSLCLEEWFKASEDEEQEHVKLFDRHFYDHDNAIIDKELEETQNLVIAIDDVSLFLNVDLLEICSKRHFILLCDDIVERFQHAIELVKSDEMRERYEQIISLLTENTAIRSKVIYYRGSDEVVREYYLDKSYAVDKFLASCITAAKEDQFNIKVISRNEAIIYKSKQLGFLTYRLTSMLDNQKEVNVWETEENRGIVH